MWGSGRPFIGSRSSRCSPRLPPKNPVRLFVLSLSFAIASRFPRVCLLMTVEIAECCPGATLWCHCSAEEIVVAVFELEGPSQGGFCRNGRHSAASGNAGAFFVALLIECAGNRLDPASGAARNREDTVHDLDAGEGIAVHARKLAELAGIIDAR